uniref:Alcohol dehydrogenase-like 5 isoform X2 n=1 Tax=Cicer arietinum TaxID=3827 RepID=A0A3Q7XKG0_CICAR|nr:alcohol dehydrogenase-like 5 isoform X2 [Cicer arietinum]
MQSVVESIGDEVRNLKEGDFIIPTYIGECEECENCVSGKTNVCLTHPVRLTGLMPDNSSRLSIKGQKLYHVLSCATWSEYVVVDVNYLTKVDPNINLAYASFISCGFSTGYGASWKEAKIETGSTVAVFGLGAVGLGAISGAKMMGASKIIGIDKNEKKKEIGEAFGMTHFINPSGSDKSPSELVKELCGMGVDYCIECTGVPTLLTQSVEATKVGIGKTIAVGIGAEPVAPFGLLAMLFGRTLKGSCFGGVKTKSDLSIIANKCQKEEFPLQELFTHEVSLVDIGKAFEFLKQPNCVKVVIRM